MSEREKRIILKRRRRRTLYRRSRPGKVVIGLALAVLLVALGIYFVGAYQKQVQYAQYPLRYKEQIVEYAERFELEPWHVAAVVRCESSFRSDAVSYAGAIGLMQIMPDTGEWLAGKFDEKQGYTSDVLYQPETNLKYGCWYLNWLMKRYEHDRTLATAAYHAGHGTVDRWLADPSVSSDGKTLSHIPYDSTRTYVARILKACQKYQELYDFTASADAD